MRTQEGMQMSEFEKKLSQLKADLNTQGARVSDQLLQAVESSFGGDAKTAKKVIEGDAHIDRVDVEIERACIALLRLGAHDEHSIRSVLTVVKVNNELERIADCAVIVAEAALRVSRSSQWHLQHFESWRIALLGWQETQMTLLPILIRI